MSEVHEKGRPIVLLTKSKLPSCEQQAMKEKRQVRYGTTQLAVLEALREYAPDPESEKREEAVQWADECELLEEKSLVSIQKKLYELDHPELKKMICDMKKKNAS